MIQFILYLCLRISSDGLDECCVCLDDPVHPVSLPCGHTFCFLCAKGLVLTDRSQSPLCSLCRRPFSPDYLESAKVLDQVTKDLNETPPLIAQQNSWQWFYEGRKGWWRFEERNCEEIEENYGKGVQQFVVNPVLSLSRGYSSLWLTLYYLYLGGTAVCG
ncbi:E3 ubiquitin-protein ligase rnf146 isoform X2 [Eurytemora carolleeae]|uniref:E3 ubiquitin-protein ligase rnf146 isoform X2 n=1 Tax=Eurytemora carolleeae TaxID=1294199 RepID=UPI000C765D59|nr:E3 ubiquitin-protein ligase rnf146 isoform X2 [Eurytemora carolleeae]|eukprot:XP_023326477.1 E3 ubiquitin-protein ligase rnf146-like isoform X2 [Eurytemora affinis]